MLVQGGHIQAEKHSCMMREQKEAQGNLLFSHWKEVDITDDTRPKLELRAWGKAIEL